MNHEDHFHVIASSLEQKLETLYVRLTLLTLLLCLAFATTLFLIQGFSAFALMQTFGMILLSFLLTSVLLFFKKKAYRRETLLVLNQGQNENTEEWVNFLRHHCIDYQLSLLLFTSGNREISG